MDETVEKDELSGDLLSDLAEIRSLAESVAGLQTLDSDALAKAELMTVMRDVERVSRCLDAGMTRLLDRCDRSGAFVVDGHRSVKPAIKHLGRISGPEAHGRVQTARHLRFLPAVAHAYESGRIPTEIVRAICRISANPRVHDFLTAADPIFAELASEMDHDKFMDWIKRWEELADADGAAEAAEHSHERRDAGVWTNAIDNTTTITSSHAGIQGAIISEIFDQFVAAEFEADMAHAKAEFGKDFTLDDLPRTPAQRRADALFEIFRRAASQPADAALPNRWSTSSSTNRPSNKNSDAPLAVAAGTTRTVNQTGPTTSSATPPTAHRYTHPTPSPPPSSVTSAAS